MLQLLKLLRKLCSQKEFEMTQPVLWLTYSLQKNKVLPSHLLKHQEKKCFKSIFCKKVSESSSNTERDYDEPDVVEELFEEGSASLSDRLDAKYPVCNMFKLFMCAVCQVEIKPGEGISIHVGSANTRNFCPWDGPFLCSSCEEKKDAMEVRRLISCINATLLP